MALTPETIDALKQALDAVVSEAGDDPKYAELADHLNAATTSLDAIGDEKDADPSDPPADAEPKDEPADEPKDDAPADEDEKPSPPDNFEDAESEFGKRMKAKRGAA